ncbi:MAG: carbohydrate kinase family protein [Anaerolineae bacterium]|nr:carbohydrate kinase family protein [Anaerolineae bacterium]
MGNGEYQILVIGSAVLDVKVRTRTMAIESGQSNPAEIQWSWGGVARNIAENLARLGADVHLLTAVGDDKAGHGLLAQLHELGIETEASLIVPEMHTGAFVGVYHFDKRLRVGFDDMQVTWQITPGHLNRWRRLFRDYDMVCLDANLSARALQTIFRLAGEYDTPVCVDPTAGLLAPRLHPFLNQIALLTPNRTEAEALVGIQLPDDAALLLGARRLAQMGVALAVITLGADGLCYATSEESGRLPAFKSEMVDPMGAGDALTAAVAYGLLEDLEPSEAVKLGLAAAAQTIICKETVCPYISLESLYEKLVV